MSFWASIGNALTPAKKDIEEINPNGGSGGNYTNLIVGVIIISALIFTAYMVFKKK